MAKGQRTTRLTISLPSDLVATVERELAQPDESRSALLRRLLEEALRSAEERRNVERYILGYREQPQTEEEFGRSDAVAAEALANERWEE